MQFGKSFERIKRRIEQLELQLEALETDEAEDRSKDAAEDQLCGTAPPAAVYFYSPDRGGEHPAHHLAGFTGFLQADGYAGYGPLHDPARGKPGPIVEVACWAHCRRKFFDVWEATGSPLAREAIDRIATLYAIETKTRFAPVARRVEHRMQTGPRLDSFFDWAGMLELDNNIAENAMRSISLGRKNDLFAGSDAGGDRAAAMYTIMQTAKLNGLDPHAYLTDTLIRIADGHPINRIGELMPWRMST